MRWKFWNRKAKPNQKLLPEAELPPSPQEQAAIEQRIFVQSLCRSAKDVLGLQQLVGNQVLLQAFAPERSQGNDRQRPNLLSGGPDRV